MSVEVSVDRRRFLANEVITTGGRIRHHQFGDGEYERSEKVIQQSLAEAGVQGIGHESAEVEGVGIEVAPDWADLRSPESYVGYDRAEILLSSILSVLNTSALLPVTENPNPKGVSRSWSLCWDEVRLIALASNSHVLIRRVPYRRW